MTDTRATHSDPVAEAVAASIPERCPVTDLATDYDMFDAYNSDEAFISSTSDQARL